MTVHVKDIRINSFAALLIEILALMVALELYWTNQQDAPQSSWSHPRMPLPRQCGLPEPRIASALSCHSESPSFILRERGRIPPIPTITEPTLSHPLAAGKLPLATDPPAANADSSKAPDEAQQANSSWAPDEAQKAESRCAKNTAAARCPPDRWSRIPFELLRPILLLMVALSPTAERPRYLLWVSLVCRGWQPAASSVLWEHVCVHISSQFDELALGSTHLSLRLGTEREAAASIRSLEFCCLPSQSSLSTFCSKLSSLRGLEIHTLLHECQPASCSTIFAQLPLLADACPSLIALSIDGSRHYECNPTLVNFVERFSWEDAEPVKVTRAIGRLDFLRLADYFDCSSIWRATAAVGAPLQVWAAICPSYEMAMTSTELPNLHTVKLGWATIRFINALVSLCPPLRSLHLFEVSSLPETALHTLLSACLSIEELSLIDVGDMTWGNFLDALEQHSPLRSLDIRRNRNTPTDRIATFLHRCGGALRSLRL
ncbi:hypothetical protein BDK51DRAFT_34803 [Blyttiomyces helicus]|uniref:F-box domain-containing protein n=1 Tax=Blyttiomyces helicus TaxID=388810 RepID=A0A4P9VWU7_9FUNG|nr:hypothetical protein BDK51DRAFT_34803 [Blyttiomyces helicus]|eukprot:RKO84174.1 hypothetical protein BDK51DRAFT_34803 [Blyttiomyces helicus]